MAWVNKLNQFHDWCVSDKPLNHTTLKQCVFVRINLISFWFSPSVQFNAAPCACGVCSCQSGFFSKIPVSHCCWLGLVFHYIFTVLWRSSLVTLNISVTFWNENILRFRQRQCCVLPVSFFYIFLHFLLFLLLKQDQKKISNTIFCINVPSR